MKQATKRIQDMNWRWMARGSALEPWRNVRSWKDRQVQHVL